MEIGKIIHLYWVPPESGDQALPAEIQENLNLWQVFHPDWELRLWKHDEAREVLLDINGLDVWGRVQMCRFPAMMSDIIRLGLLVQFGGFWSDLKNRPLKGFLDSASRSTELVLAEHWATRERPNPHEYFCNSLLGAGRGNPFVTECLNEVCRAIDSRQQGSVFGITGGSVLQRVIRRAAQSGENPYQYKILRYADLWGTMLIRTPGPYNKDGQHWSERQKHESLYV